MPQAAITTTSPATVISSLLKLRSDIQTTDAAMQGDRQGNGARAPDGDDYNTLHQRVMAALAELDTGDKPIAHVVVTCEGGLVTGLNADHAGIYVLVKDYDTEGTLLENLPQDTDGDEYCFNNDVAFHNPDLVQLTFEQVAAAAALEES